MKYFFDTNILSYLFKKQNNFINKFIELGKREEVDFCISRVTYYELKRGFLAIGANSKIKLLNQYMMAFDIYEMQDSTFDLAAKIYANLKQKGNLIEDDDIFIGAAALENDAILVTNNAKHLGRIDGLKLEIWGE